MKELLKVENLIVDFAAYNGTVRAVRGVSFTVCEGETLAMTRTVAFFFEGKSLIIHSSSSLAKSS